MKQCAECGAMIDDAVAFCPHCGSKVEQPAQNQQANYGTAQQSFQAGGAALKLKTNRSLVAFVLLSMITAGIYGIVVLSEVSTSINTIAERYDGKKTMHYCLVFFVFTWLTAGVVPLVWGHRISARIGNELTRRGIAYKFGASDFWLWGILGSFIIVGPFIYFYRFLNSMNKLSENYNRYGF